MPHVFKVVSTLAGGNFIPSPALISGNGSASRFWHDFSFHTHANQHWAKRLRGLLVDLCSPRWKAPSSPVLFPANSSYCGLPKCHVSSSLWQDHMCSRPSTAAWELPPGARLGCCGVTSLCPPSPRDHKLLLAIGLKTILSHTFYSF